MPMFPTSLILGASAGGSDEMRASRMLFHISDSICPCHGLFDVTDCLIVQTSIRDHRHEGKTYPAAAPMLSAASLAAETTSAAPC